MARSEWKPWWSDCRRAAPAHPFPGPPAGSSPRWRSRRTLAPIAVVASAAALLCQPAFATLWVANNGLDSSSSCSSAEPCRTITRAIQVATIDELIKVRPGIYGDIDGDGAFTSVGDEVSGDPDCVVKVDKRVRLQSASGTTPTVITAGGADMHVICVDAFQTRVVGFTMTRNGANRSALRVTGGIHQVFHVRNNFAVGTGAGFEIEGKHSPITGNRAIATAGTGFTTRPNHIIGMRRNVAMDNGEHGFRTFDSLEPLSNRWRENVAGGNRLAGIFVDTAGQHEIRSNHVLGNRRHGIHVEAGGPTLPVMMNNNVYGNATEVGFSLANCGLYNDSAALVTASSTYWGAAAPGPDPADEECTGIGATTVLTSGATAPNAGVLGTLR